MLLPVTPDDVILQPWFTSWSGSTDHLSCLLHPPGPHGPGPDDAPQHLLLWATPICLLGLASVTSGDVYRSLQFCLRLAPEDKLTETAVRELAVPC